MEAFICRMDKQGATVEHRELYSISYDKPYGKEYFLKKVFSEIDTHIHTTFITVYCYNHPILLLFLVSYCA